MSGKTSPALRYGRRRRLRRTVFHHDYMKKVIIMALIITVSACFNAADARKKKEADSSATVAVVPVTSADTLAYAAGMAQTEGLIPFLKRQFNVDTVHVSDFARGYREAAGHEFSDEYNAYIAGMQVAGLLHRNMLPRVREALAATGDTAVNVRMFDEGFMAAVMGNAVMPDSTASVVYETAVEAAKRKASEATINEGEEFLSANKLKEGVVTTASGLQYKVLVKGEGKIPAATDEVIVKYEGRLINGTVFDSSYKRKNQESKFRADKVIKGWTEALTMMPVGSKWELYIPQELAYGSHQKGKIPPYSTLIFTVELVGF